MNNFSHINLSHKNKKLNVKKKKKFFSEFLIFKKNKFL
jgi:hypothetical protein